MTVSTMTVDREKIRAVYARLVDSYGALALRPGGDPLDELIGTILAQSTSYGHVWRSLKTEHPE